VFSIRKKLYAGLEQLKRLDWMTELFFFLIGPFKSAFSI